MIYGLKYVAKRLLGKDVAGRNFAIYPDDTFLVSYPRSGNTWTRRVVTGGMGPNLIAGGNQSLRGDPAALTMAVADEPPPRLRPIHLEKGERRQSAALGGEPVRRDPQRSGAFEKGDRGIRAGVDADRDQCHHHRRGESTHGSAAPDST